MKIAFISTVVSQITMEVLNSLPNIFQWGWLHVGMRLWYIHLISILIKKTLIKEYV